VGRDVRARTELRNVLRDGLIWALGIMFVLGIMGALLIRSLFRRMMRDISTTTRAIARGDLTKRIPKTGDGDEFDELAEIINDMLDRISRLMDGVRQVSNAIAHDLRTPITRARTRLEDASLHAHTAEDLQSAIERATLDLDGIVGVFEALLRIAEIEAGSRRAAFAAIDLAPMLHDIDELYRAVAEERGLVLETSIASRLPILGDRELVQQAVANLLDNALKFSAPATTIRFTARLEEALIEICIADRGPGISDEDRNRATERFFRAESARSTSGSGLGLALVSAVAQLHNGTLHLADNHPGLRAIITLPARLDGAASESYSLASSRASRPSMIWPGVGGQPAMMRSTGRMASAPPRTAGAPLKTPPSTAQSPTAMTKAGSGMAARVARTASSMLCAATPVMSRMSAWRGLGVKVRPYWVRS
jgi:signal transduction histidine kinase